MTAQAARRKQRRPRSTQAKNWGAACFPQRRPGGGARPTVFLERPGVREISVDRLTLAPPDEAVAIADAVAAGREGNRSFYG